ncbi:MAG: hypothetical protein OK442_03575 [Thaumarchaeota archaeon]|nr:hypothetical protein [Nitrososphaerota archaeon]
MTKGNLARAKSAAGNGRSALSYKAARRTAIGSVSIAISAVVIALVVILMVTTISPQSATTSASMSTSTNGGGPASSTSSGARNSSNASSATSSSSATSYAYLSAGGGCSADGKAAPCWGGAAYVFNCLSAAGTQQGCTQLVSTTTPDWNFTVNIRYPFNQTMPSWANCQWDVVGEIPGQGYGYCSAVNSTSFIIGQPSAPPQ